MEHHRNYKRKPDDDSLCAHPSKRTRLSMVPDSTAPSRQSSPPAKNESTAVRHCGSVASSPQSSSYLNSLPNIPPSPSNPTVSTSPQHSAVSPQEPVSAMSLFPPINRDTLKELDLDVVLRHPQLRHDFLFDSGLQFRTMTGGRKHYIANQYWSAVLDELEHALLESIPPRSLAKKRTRPPTPPPWSEKHYSAYLHAATDPHVIDALNPAVISPPLPGRRLPALLITLVEVLTYVIGPVASEKTQALPLSQILSNIDILLIDRELRYGLYEPAGLFNLIGQLLKAHCAPMRDGKVDVMVAVAKGSLNPSGLFGPAFSTASEFHPPTDKQRSIRRTIGSLRICFEILELMKLDIANHHLHHLRPFLLTSGPDFLHRAFVDRVQRGFTSLENTRKFLNDAYKNFMTTTHAGDEESSSSTGQAVLSTIRDSVASAIDNSVHPLEGYPQGLKVHLAFIASLTDMIFNPPTFDSWVCQCGLVLPMNDFRLPIAKHSNQQHMHDLKKHRSFGSNQSSWPETLWLDSNRIAQLIGDIADLTALYVLLMGWRMLVFAKQDNTGFPSSISSASSSSSSSHTHTECDDARKMMPAYTRSSSKLEDWEIDRVKKEVWSIAPRRFGSCFFWDDSSRAGVKSTDHSNNDQTRQAWKEGMENVALHIAMRAEDARQNQDSVPQEESRPMSSSRMPSSESITLLRSWLDTHMRRSSTLTARLRKLVTTEVAITAAKMTLHMVSVNSILENGPRFTTQTSNGDSTSTAQLYNTTSAFPETRRVSIPSLLSPHSHAPNSRIPPPSHSISPHRGINIVPSPAAVSAGLEPLMPEIKHLANRIAKLTYINLKIFWSLYTAPGFLDLDGPVTASPTTTTFPAIVTSEKSPPQREYGVKFEEEEFLSPINA
ncbi:hypothetical protein Clacol_009927 [Clathrus columnatus]|uniref:Tcp11-domain-containing protein n=1 Tax=Clathrus columnatus TaxID=1419009 RepID=A0AAV5AR67_9AGAM|nr:hypothetical protein Clacol_009927 [Clathrus columnatus]